MKPCRLKSHESQTNPSLQRKERLGHASIKTKLDTYGHLFDGMDEAAADRLDEAWRVSPVDATWTRPVPSVISISSQ